jgi:hypothetical protein
MHNETKTTQCIHISDSWIPTEGEPEWSLVEWIEANAAMTSQPGHGRQRSPAPWHSTLSRSGQLSNLYQTVLFTYCNFISTNSTAVISTGGFGIISLMGTFSLGPNEEVGAQFLGRCARKCLYTSIYIVVAPQSVFVEKQHKDSTQVYYTQ